MQLKFTVRGQQIFRVDKIPLASDSRLYIAGAVDFDSEWDDITARWLTFEPRTGTAITAVLADGNSFEESLGVSLSAGTWRVSAHGTNTAGKEIHTTPVLLNVAQAGGRDGEAPPYVPPDAAGQIAAVAEEARDTANRAMELAEQSGENAEIAKAAAASAVESEKKAVDAATEAQKSAEEAAESAKEAAAAGSKELTADDAIDLLAETGMIEPVSDADGALLTDSIGNIYIL